MQVKLHIYTVILYTTIYIAIRDSSETVHKMALSNRENIWHWCPLSMLRLGDGHEPVEHLWTAAAAAAGLARLHHQGVQLNHVLKWVWALG